MNIQNQGSVYKANNTFNGNDFGMQMLDSDGNFIKPKSEINEIRDCYFSIKKKNAPNKEDLLSNTI